MTRSALVSTSTARALALLWKAPVGGLVALLTAVVVATVALGFAGVAPTPSADADPHLVLAGALLPVALLVLATTGGLLWAISSVGVLTGEAVSGRPPRLVPALSRGLRALPRLVAVALLGAVAVLASVVAFPVVSLAALGRGGWRLRAGTGRRRELLLAVPFAGTLVLLAAVPVALAGVLRPAPLRSAVRVGLALTWAARGRLMLGAAVLGVVSWGLGVAGVHLSGISAAAADGRARTTAQFATGTAGLGLMTLLLTLVAGALLGLLSARVGATQPEDPAETTPGDVGLRVPAQRSARLLSWRPARIAAVALFVSATLTIEIAGSAAVAPPAAAATLPPSAAVAGADLVVTSLADSAAPAAGECVDAGATCTLRGALVQADARALDGPVTVGFDVAGTIAVVDTLMLPKGLILDATGQAITLDAGGAVRALHAYDPAGESAGGQVTLRGLTVTGGRSSDPGAGLWSDNVNVVLEQMTFSGNTSGVDPPDGSRADGGAVSVPYATVTVRDSTFTGNRALTGTGAAVNAGRLDWLNSTSFEDRGVVGQPDGGAVQAGAGTVHHATLIGGGGIAGGSWGPLGVTNSIIDVGAGAGDFTCRYTSGQTDDPPSGGNVDPSGMCVGLTGRPSPHGPLADNGGPTRTVALLPGSPALGAGLAASCAATDQRGTPRPATRCDAGAFQMASGDLPVVTVTLTSDANPSGLGGDTTLRAALTSPQPVPAGTVQLLDGTTPVGPPATPDAAGVAVLTTTALAQGAHELTASFTPSDTSLPAVTSEPVRQVVQAAVTLSITAPAPTRVHDPAVITVTVVPAPGSDPALSPSGTVDVSSGTQTASLPLVGGAATWTVPTLTSAMVTANYAGDDAFSWTVATVDVTSADIATSTVVTLDPAAVPFGTPSTATVRVTDAVGPVVGTVELVVDGAVHGNAVPLDAGARAFELALAPGAHTVLARTTPGAGWEASESEPVILTVTAATSTVVITAPATSSYGETVAVEATLTGVGTATVELLDGDTVVDTSPALTLPTTFSLHAVGGMDVGAHALTARIVASATTAGAVSAPVTHTVTPQATGLSATAFGATLGSPATLTATPSVPELPGLLTATDPTTGTVLASVRRSGTDTGSSSLSYVPGSAGTHSALVRFEPDSANYSGAVTTVSFDVAKAAPPTPTVSWSATPVPGSTTLTVQYPPTSPAVGPAGLLVYDHERRMYVASGWLVDGRAELSFYGPAGECYCSGLLRLEFAGDSNYLPAWTAVPDLVLPAHVTTTTLAPLPSSVPRFARLDLVANVASPTLWPLTGSVVFTVNGLPQPPVALPSSGRAYQQYVPSGPGTYRISAAYVPDTTTAGPSASAMSEVTVEVAPLPRVELSTTAAAAVDRSMYLQVWTRSHADLVVPGSQLALVDETGALLGSSTWESGGYSAFFLHTPLTSGPQTLRVRFVYGPDTTVGFSEPLTIDVAGLWSPLFLFADESVFAATVDGPLWLRAGLRTTPERRETLGTMQVSLYADGVLLETRPLHPWEETVWFPASQDRIGPVVYTVTTTGDGLKFAAGSGRLDLTVAGAPAQLQLEQASSLHRGPWTVPFGLTALPGRAAPTGTVWITLTDPDGGRTYSGCQVTLPAASCTQDGTWLPAGTYRTSATYSGDGVYASSSDSDTLYVTSTPSGVETTFDPPRREWVEGTPVTASWTTTVPAGSPGSGVVAVQHGAQERGYYELCRAPAEAGGCAFTVPTDHRPLRALTDDERISQHYRTEFTPAAAGLDPSRDYEFGPPVPRCLQVTSATTFTNYRGDRYPPAPTLEGTACSVDGRSGYREGTQVSAQLTIGKPYAVGRWHLQDGVGPRDDAAEVWAGSDWSSFELEEQTRVVAHLVWAPDCVSVVVAAEPGSRYLYDPRVAYDPGVVTLRTKPNCADPVTPSAYELAELQKGIGWYAVGTDVELSAYPRNPRVPTVDKPAYVLVDVPDVRPPDEDDYYYELTATEDREVYARFRLSKRMCTPTRFFTGGGGALALLGSELNPTVTYPLEDRTGTCVDPAGKAGFWPGTTVRVAAKGHNDGTGSPGPSNFRFDTWLEGPGPDAPLHQDQGTPARNNPDWSYTAAVPSAQEVALRPRTTSEAAPRSHYDTVKGRVVVPLSPDFRFGVRFASVDCQAVETALTYPVDKYGQGSPAGVVRTPGNCPAMAHDNATWTSGPTGGGWYDAVEKTKTLHTRTWYLPGTTVTATAPAQTFQTQVPVDRWSAYRQTRDASSERTVDWVVREQGGATGPVTTTPQVVVTTGKRTVLEGRYVTRGADCITPKVSVHPERFGYQVVGGGGCPEGQMNPLEGTLRAKHTAGMAQGVRTHWTFHGPAWKVPEQQGREQLDYYNTAVATSQITFDDPRYYRLSLHYCAPIDIGISVVDAAGNHVTHYNDAQGHQVSAPRADKIFGAAGGCPVPLSIEPGKQAQVGLNNAGVNSWTVRGWRVNGQSVVGTPTVRVDANGHVLDQVGVTLTPKCHTLATSHKVFVRTRGDCPGGGDRSYLHGTPVEVSFNGGATDEFQTWRDVDASDGGVAVAVMYRNRNVTAEYRTPGGLELVVKVATSLTQRALAFLVAAATSAVMGLLFVVQAASLVVVGVTTALRAMGVDGAVLDRVEGVTGAVQSALDTIQSVQDCTISWSAGGAGPALSIPSAQGSQATGVASTLAEDALEAKGYTRAADGLGAASSAFDTVNIFASGLGAYFAEPRDSWSAFAGIGSCVRDSALDTANRAQGAVT
jgi:hypothetical protein